MTYSRAIAFAAGAVLLAAVAGAGITGDPRYGPYATIVMPVWTPPLLIWAAIGGIYYFGMGVVLTRLLHKNKAVIPVLLVLAANEAWNVCLFRIGSTTLAFWTLIPFAALVVLAAFWARRADRLSAGFLFLYAGWLGFDLVWVARLMALN